MFSNNQNLEFYNVLPKGSFDQLATVPAGLSDAPDIQRLLPRLGFHPDTCLEVGAGSGRVITALLRQLDPVPLIYAIERVPHFIESLEEQFKNSPQVLVMKGDILTRPIPTSQLSLWMFSGICEFSLGEQRILVEKLSRSTTKALAIDVPVYESVQHLTEKGSDYITTKHDHGGTLFLHFPTPAEIKEMQEASYFTSLDSLTYETSSGRTRTSYLLRK